MDKSNPLQVLVRTYAFALIDKIGDAKKAADRTGDPFELGRTGGFHLALHMLIIRARALGIELREIGLDGIDPNDFA